MVSRDATNCPACGHPLTRHGGKMARGPAGCLLSLVLLGLLLAMIIGTGEQSDKAEKENPTCISDYTKCMDNEELIRRHTAPNGAFMSVACQMTAERMAKYGKPKFSFVPFGSYFDGRSYIDTGTAVLLDHNAQFQNGFGAYQNVTARCEYDLKNDTTTVELISK